MAGKGVKTVVLAVGLIVALVAGYATGRWGSHDGHGHEAGEKGEKTQYTCGMHPFIIQDEPGLCPICGMNLTPMKPDGGGAGDTGENAVVIDPVTIQNMGVRTAAVLREELRREIRTVGRIGYEESKQYVVSSKIGGWIERLHVNQTGQPVRQGEPLLDIYSPELVAAQEEYLLALRNRSELARSSFTEIAAGGERLLEAARQRLKYWDISERQIAELEKSGRVRKTMTLHAPFSGVVTEKKAFEGMNVMPGADLLQISDISQVWVQADIFEYELPWVKPGQPATVEIPYGVDRTLQGTVAYVYPYVQPQTRTVQVRVELPNPGFELKPEMFVNVRLQVESAADVLAIPGDAVLQSGRERHVFVALGEGRFEPRQVKVGLQGDNGRVQILSGLEEGERVVTSAQFMLDSESRLREAIQKMMTPAGAGAPGHDDHEAARQELEELFQ